jgi:hypothetical protein
LRKHPTLIVGVLVASVIFFAASGSATPVARIILSASSNALRVPVVLDGSTSTGCNQYYWEQISGSPRLDLIGQGWPKAMLLSVTSPGTYTFRLVVSDGSASHSNMAIVTFIQPVDRTIFVDNRLSAPCLATNYSIADRNASGTDAVAYATIQAAANISQPGDVIYIRGGSYSNEMVGQLTFQTMVNINRGGTVTAPIRYEAYNGESVKLVGFGFEDRDLDSDGYADGGPPGVRETLFKISYGANYVQVRGLELFASSGSGMVVGGSYCYVEECLSHDHWYAGATIVHEKNTNTQAGVVFRWLETHHNRRDNGLLITLYDTATYGVQSDCAMVDCLAYANGREPSNQKVIPARGDPQGGGNSDGIGSSKFSIDNAYFYPQYGRLNWATNLYFVRNIVWSNADDGFDLSCANSLVEDNRALLNGPNGPMGFKHLSQVDGMAYQGNLAYGNTNGAGFDLRVATNGTLQLFNNSSVRNKSAGLAWNYPSNKVLIATNNLAAFNAQGDNGGLRGINWAVDGSGQYSGDPRLSNTNFSLRVNFQPGWSVRQKRDYLESQIRLALCPAPNSPLLHAGLLIPGYHCPKADDDPFSPMPPDAPGRHWLRPAPDLGAPLNLVTFTNSASRPARPTGLRVQ